MNNYCLDGHKQAWSFLKTSKIQKLSFNKAQIEFIKKITDMESELFPR